MATATMTKTRALPPLPALTDHEPYAEALAKAERIDAKMRPIAVEMREIEADFTRVVTEERAAAKQDPRRRRLSPPSSPGTNRPPTGRPTTRASV